MGVLLFPFAAIFGLLSGGRTPLKYTEDSLDVLVVDGKLSA